MAYTVRNARELSTIAYLVSLGGQSGTNIRKGSLVQLMLIHFDTKIINIDRDVLDNSSDGMLWRIAEECYKQASSSSGTLHTDNYFIPRDEALLQSLYDPDFEDEEYYEHEDRLAIDEDYAKAMEVRILHRQEARKREEESWVNFWGLVLSGCSDGPTLFYPPANHEIKFHLLGTTDIPQCCILSENES